MSKRQSPESITISITPCDLVARVWGPADGPRVLALHGWLDNSASFDDLVALLPGLRVVALDLPGHGLSQHHPAGLLYGLVDLVAEVAEAADALGWERFALLGHSLGAGIASMLAGTFPQRITRLALVEGLGPLTAEPEQAPERLAASYRDWQRRRGRTPPLYPNRADAVRRLVKAGGMIEASAEKLVARGTVEAEGGVTWRSDHQLRVPSRLRLTEAHVHAFLRCIECPTLGIRARDGLAFDAGALAKRKECVRALEYVELDGGHHVHLDAPDRVARVLAPFFAPLVEQGRLG